MKAIHVRVRPSNGYLSTEYPFYFSPFTISTVTLFLVWGAVEFCLLQSVSCMSKPLTTSPGLTMIMFSLVILGKNIYYSADSYQGQNRRHSFIHSWKR
jgi:hypothetical protein